MTTTRRNLIYGGAAGLAAAFTSGPASSIRVVWGDFVIHHATPNPRLRHKIASDGSGVSVRVDDFRAEIGEDSPAPAASAAFAGHFPLEVPHSLNVFGFVSDVRGVVRIVGGGRASLLVETAGATRAHEWAMGADGREIYTIRVVKDLERFSQADRIGRPPPATFSLGFSLHVQKLAPGNQVLLSVESIDISMVIQR